MRGLGPVHGLVRGALRSLSALLLASGVAHAAIPASERQALLDLYTSTNGAGWTTKTNWNGPAGTECTWYGVTCNLAATEVTQISLDSNHLVGPLPPSLGTLPALFNLSLEHNQLSGPIPSFATDVVLKYLLLSYNQLTGSIPSFGSNPALQYLMLGSNQLSGPIPSFVANSGLAFLHLDSNHLSGSITPFNSPGLMDLRLANNQLTGSIPSFASCTSLGTLYLDSNQLSGPIPSFASNAQLVELGLISNQLSGSIPSFASNTSLNWLSLSSNQLTGTIPSFAANTALENLLLDHNQLTGSIPSFAANTSLKLLVLSGNQFSGPFPSLGSNTALQFLSLSSNRLTGPVDASLGTLTNLVGGGLDLRWNALSSANPTLTAFLNSKQDGGDWQSTQTTPVTGLGASGITGTQVTVNWTPIVYTGDTGNYQVFTSTTSGGPYAPFAAVTPNKSATSLTVTGLAPGTPYFFTVQTTTAPHANNQNTVLSGQSAELRAVTAGAPQDAAQVPAAGTTSLLVFAGLLSALGALRIARVSA